MKIYVCNKCGGTLSSQKKFRKYCLVCGHSSTFLKSQKDIKKILEQKDYDDYVFIRDFLDNDFWEIIESLGRDGVIFTHRKKDNYCYISTRLWWIKKYVGRNRIDKELGFPFSLCFKFNYPTEWDIAKRLIYNFYDKDNCKNFIKRRQGNVKKNSGKFETYKKLYKFLLIYGGIISNPFEFEDKKFEELMEAGIKNNEISILVENNEIKKEEIPNILKMIKNWNVPNIKGEIFYSWLRTKDFKF